ncbi:hypothetical protein CPLU01_10954 [Colletotrichum plurivorum]|uniref:F-box domain-containing protein n=1 Tax=Colletotrichum plurivorum TaxID=2175906 RepID=A0A8H6N8M1_9PEZI|nr:hypothetical protein CPLU01_10954 [Colletotrichum plurivorum]
MKLRSQTRREEQEEALRERLLSDTTIKLHEQQTARWTRLPPEIRRMIMQLVQSFSADKKYSMARLTTVSKEWQSFFEPAIWRTLTLQPGNLRSGFLGLRGHIKSDRREMIKCVSLCVDMEHYICPRCKREIGDQHTIINREKKLFNNLRRLFSILGDWPNDSPSMSTGIWLDLAQKQPSERGKEDTCKGKSSLGPRPLPRPLRLPPPLLPPRPASAMLAFRAACPPSPAARGRPPSSVPGRRPALPPPEEDLPEGGDYVYSDDDIEMDLGEKDEDEDDE